MDKWMMDSTKLMCHPDRLASFLKGKRIMPITIDAGVHKGCNINCRYCYGVKQGKGAKYIPEDRLLLLAQDMHDCGIKAIAVIGDGEPTLNKGLYAFVTRLHDLGIDAAVATNGLLLSPYQIETLTNNLTWLRFSVSGVENYESIMGAPKGSFKILERAVNHAVKNKGDCTIGLQSVLIPEGFGDTISLAEKAIEWGVEYLVIKQFSDGGEGMPLHFDMDEYEKATDILKKAEAMSTEKTQIVVKWEAIRNTRAITKENKYEFEHCRSLPFLFQISGDGGCFVCGPLFGKKEYCYGNLCEERLTDILHSEKYWGIIKKIAGMELKDLCSGQCRHCEINKYIQKIVNPPKHINFI